MRRWRADPLNAIKHRESSARWRAEHRAEHHAYTKQYKIDHPDWQRKWWARNADELNDRRAMRAYGVDAEHLEAARHGACAICGEREKILRVRRLSIDHDHKTGFARGLLCGSCNVALGYYERGNQNTKFHRLGLVAVVERYLGR